MASFNAWTEANSDSCLDWTAGMHLDVASDLLDGLEVKSISEHGLGDQPPHRHYTATDPDALKGEENDYGPFLAALIHVGIALVKQGWEPRA